MSIFDILKNHSDDSAVAVIATIAVQREESGGITAKTAGTATATPQSEKTEIPPGGWETDPVILAERIGIRFEQEIPEDLGKPVFVYRGHVLAWEADPPHIKVYSWATVNLFPGRPLSIDIEPTARLLELSPGEVRGALARLVGEGDLVRTRERGRDLYRLNVQYRGGEDEAGT